MFKTLEEKIHTLSRDSSESENVSVVPNSLQSHGLIQCAWNSPGHITGVGSLSLLQGMVQTQGLNPGLPHCRRILYQLSHKRSPRMLEWVAYPFSIGSSQPRNRTRVSCIAGGFFTNWAMREASRDAEDRKTKQKTQWSKSVELNWYLAKINKTDKLQIQWF